MMTTTVTFLQQSDLERIRSFVVKAPVNGQNGHCSGLNVPTTDGNSSILTQNHRPGHRASPTGPVGLPKTLQGQRDQRRKEREAKLAAAEAARQEVDLRHALEEKQMQELYIRRASKMLWDEREDSRALHSKILLCEVMEERSAQIRHATEIAAEKKDAEMHLLASLRERWQKENQVEVDKNLKIKDRNLREKELQKGQLEELQRTLLAERELRLQEGLALQEAALKEATELQKAEDEARDRAKKAHLETMAANETFKTLKLLQQEQARQLDQANAAYAKARENKELALKEAQEARQKTREAHRQQMVAIMEKTYSKFMEQTDSRLLKNIKETEDKLAAKEAEDQHMALKELARIDRSRKEQLKAKEKQSQDEKLAERAHAAAYQMRLKDIEAEEIVNANKSREQHKQSMRFLQTQIDAKTTKHQAKLQNDRMDAYMRLHSLSGDRRKFQQYADICINELAKQGKNTGPLQSFVRKNLKTTGLEENCLKAATCCR